MTSLDVVVPVHNELDRMAALPRSPHPFRQEHFWEWGLPYNISCLHGFMSREMQPYRWTITIAENGSTDATPHLARLLAERLPSTSAVTYPEPGRGRALRRTWLESQADILCYMDSDLSTALEALPRLVQAVEAGADIAIGSRLHPDSTVIRSWKREALSRGYNLLVRTLHHAPFRDAQCGFKAITRQAARALLPLTRDNGWFFDTELLLLAARRGYRIQEIPVIWDEADASTVNLRRTVIQDIRGLLRLRLTFWGIGGNGATE